MIFQIAVCAIVLASAGEKGGKTSPTDPDSLRTLKIILSSEFKQGNEVLKLRDTRKTDSLIQRDREKSAFLRALRDTSLAREVKDEKTFQDYWARIESQNGISDLKGQMASHDIDKSRIPKAFLFDSTVVVYPGWIILRRVGR